MELIAIGQQGDDVSNEWQEVIKVTGLTTKKNQRKTSKLRLRKKLPKPWRKAFSLLSELHPHQGLSLAFAVVETSAPTLPLPLNKEFRVVFVMEI